jgi:hypothetical protein
MQTKNSKRQTEGVTRVGSSGLLGIRNISYQCLNRLWRILPCVWLLCTGSGQCESSTHQNIELSRVSEIGAYRSGSPLQFGSDVFLWRPLTPNGGEPPTEKRQKTSLALTDSSRPLSADSQLVGDQRPGQCTANAGGNKPSNLQIWIDVAQQLVESMICGSLGGIIGALIYWRLMPNYTLY